MKLLIVEDEELLLNIVAKGLKKYGYAVDTAEDGEIALEMFDLNEYDLVVLDLNLPRIDGLEVLRIIRKKNLEVKIIILTARSTVEDKILGLDDGANDYLVKPFDFLELEARIRCLLRQTTYLQDKIIKAKDVVLDTTKRSVLINQIPLELTKKEYGILEYLMMNKNQIISLENIINHVWDSEADLFSNTFKFHMSSLKRKIAGRSEQEIIRNIRGSGYIVED